MNALGTGGRVRGYKGMSGFMKVNHDAALLWRPGLPESGRRDCHEGVTSRWLILPRPHHVWSLAAMPAMPTGD